MSEQSSRDTALLCLLQRALPEVLWSVLEGLGPLPATLLDRLRATRSCLTKEAILGLWRPLLEDSPDQIAAAVDRSIAGLDVAVVSLHGAAP